MKRKIFVTGGAGYIGSHTCVDLLRKNNEILIFDDLSNSSVDAIRKIELLANRKLSFVKGDIRNINVLDEAFSKFRPDSVIHFAGLKAVDQSLKKPVEYYDVNVHGSINLLKAMSNNFCNEIIFSSSATVYGNANIPPFNEATQVNPVSPYGRTKLICENIFEDWVNSNQENRAVMLRYFNPVGAHPSGLIGEDPKGEPNNLMPLIVRAVQNDDFTLSIYGSDYDTRDGTGERDFIHVSDLAYGHLQALENISSLRRFEVLNLGSGISTTVKELIETFEKKNEVFVPKLLAKRRQGDVAKSLADPTRARALIGFKCKKTVADMCVDTWTWVQKNPNGFQ